MLEKDATPAIFKSTMLKKDADFWFDTWVKKGNTLLEVISWMNDEGLVDIGQITFLEYAAAIFLANDKSFGSKKFKEEIKKYAIYLRLTDGSFTKSNLNIVETLHDISKNLTDGAHGLDKYEYSSPVGKINLTQDAILKATTSTAIFKTRPLRNSQSLIFISTFTIFQKRFSKILHIFHKNLKIACLSSFFLLYFFIFNLLPLIRHNNPVDDSSA